MIKKEKFSKENLQKIIKDSFSIKEVLHKMNLRAAGGNYKNFHKYIKLYQIDISHFDERTKIFQRTLAVYQLKNKKNIDEILVENSTYSRTALKKRLYEEGLKQRECELCGQGEMWFGKKMSLILDHKNGIYNDNRLINLRIVCPNCNGTLDTHCGKNLKKITKCSDCDIIIGNKSKKCKKCSNIKKTFLHRRKVKIRPSLEQLQKDIFELGYTGTGRKYHVSDNSIRKWIENYKINII